MKTSETSRELKLSFHELAELDELYFSDSDFSGVNLMADTLKAWFAECWWKAGGWDYKVSAEVGVHDGHGHSGAIQLTEAHQL